MTRPRNWYYAIGTVHLYQPTPLFPSFFSELTTQNSFFHFRVSLPELSSRVYTLLSYGSVPASGPTLWPTGPRTEPSGLAYTYIHPLSGGNSCWNSVYNSIQNREFSFSMEACLRARNFRSPPVPPKLSISIARLTSSGSCTGILIVLTSWSLFSHFELVVELPLGGAKLSRGHVLSLLSLSYWTNRKGSQSLRLYSKERGNWFARQPLTDWTR